MSDMKKESSHTIEETQEAENTQKELSDEQLNGVAGGKTMGPNHQTIKIVPKPTSVV